MSPSPNPAAIRILVIDDHALFRRGLISLLLQDPRFAVVGEAADAGEALRRAAQHQPDLILLDNHLPGVRGIDAITDLREAAPDARLLMLTISEDEQDLAAALRYGAQGYLLKTVDGDKLTHAILQAMAGESIISPEMTGKLIDILRATQSEAAEPAPPTNPLDTLSPREHDILIQIVRGASNKAIARTFDIAETTVKIHVHHILRKLGFKSRVQAAVYAAGKIMTEED